MQANNVWFTPRSFCEHFLDDPVILSTLISIDFEYGDTDASDVSMRISEQMPLSRSDLDLVKLEWRAEIRGVALLTDYVAAAKAGEIRQIHSPLVDKRHGLILDTEAHEVTAEYFLVAHDGIESVGDETPYIAYILRGHGYYRSSQCWKYYVGQVLFDNNALTEDDAFLIEGKTGVVACDKDFYSILWLGR